MHEVHTILSEDAHDAEGKNGASYRMPSEQPFTGAMFPSVIPTCVRLQVWQLSTALLAVLTQADSSQPWTAESLDISHGHSCQSVCKSATGIIWDQTICY